MKHNNLPSREWARDQLKASNTYPPLATSVLRLWEVMETMSATTDQYTEMLSLASTLVEGTALHEDNDSDAADWVANRGLVTVGATARIRSDAFNPDSDKYQLNGRVGKVVGVRNGYASIYLDGNAEGMASVDADFLAVRVG